MILLLKELNMNRVLLAFSFLLFPSLALPRDKMPVIDFSKELNSSRKADGNLNLRWNSTYRLFEVGKEAFSSFNLSSSGKIGRYSNAIFDAEVYTNSNRGSKLTPRLHELLYGLQYRSLELSAGIQKFDWGQMDFFSPANQLAAVDYSKGISGDFKSPLRGSPALRMKLTSSFSYIEVIYRPFAEIHLLPGTGSPWDKISSTLAFIPGAGAQEQDRQYGGQGVRLAANIASMGLKLIHYSGYESFQIDDQNPIATQPTALEYNALAVDFGLGAFIAKGELASGVRNIYYLSPVQIMEEEASFQAMSIGLDYSVDPLSFSLEASHLVLNSKNESLLPIFKGKDSLSAQSTLSLIDGDLLLSVIGQKAISEDERLLVLKGEVLISETIGLEFGYVNFTGPDSSLFGQFKLQEHFYTQVKVRF